MTAVHIDITDNEAPSIVSPATLKGSIPIIQHNDNIIETILNNSATYSFISNQYKHPQMLKISIIQTLVVFSYTNNKQCLYICIVIMIQIHDTYN